jgi:hypothetical protein
VIDSDCIVDKLAAMCRNIKTLANFEPPATSDEIRAAALQFVRKVSGSVKPSKVNQSLFDATIEEITSTTTHLLQHLVAQSAPKNRGIEAAKAKAKWQHRQTR